jgi:hypothetical protein
LIPALEARTEYSSRIFNARKLIGMIPDISRLATFSSRANAS